VARRIRPSKPMAIFSAGAGAVILTIGIVTAAVGDAPLPFMVLWVAFGVAIIAVNLWTAFGRNGHIYTVEDV
jgi:hypothetical protein